MTQRSIPRYPGEADDELSQACDPPLDYPGASMTYEKKDGCVASEVCKEAAKIVAGRSDTHGGKERSFEAIARRWAGHIFDRYGIIVPLSASDVGMMQIELKLARAACGKMTRDHFVDIAGYSGCTWEVENGL